jgi:hypothetical protein
MSLSLMCSEVKICIIAFFTAEDMLNMHLTSGEWKQLVELCMRRIAMLMLRRMRSTEREAKFIIEEYKKWVKTAEDARFMLGTARANYNKLVRKCKDANVYFPPMLDDHMIEDQMPPAMMRQRDRWGHNPASHGDDSDNSYSDESHSEDDE